VTKKYTFGYFWRSKIGFGGLANFGLLFKTLMDTLGDLSAYFVFVVTTVSPAKMAEPIEMPFGLMTHVGARYQVLDGRSKFPKKNGI